MLGIMDLGIPQNLQDKLDEYEKVVNLGAFRSPSEKEKAELTLEQASEIGKETLAKAFPDAVREIYRLSQGASSESVRAQCSRYISDMVVGKNSPIAEDDDMKQLLKKIMKQEIPSEPVA